MNKKIILLIVIIIIGGVIYYFEKMKVGDIDIVDKVREVVELKEGKYSKAPELQGIVGYLNTEDSLRISDLNGKVVLVDFWTYTCINCIRTLPFLNEWNEKYRDKGLVIIGVHTPEFGFEKKYENVQDAIDKYDIKYAVVQDNDYATWGAYRNRFWPHKYLIDSEGFIRYDHIGEGGYEETERKIQELLAEIGKDVSDMETSELEDKTPRLRQTPELYAGYDFALPRGQDLGNEEGIKRDQIVDYFLPDKIKKDIIYLEGEWKGNKDDLEVVGEKGSIVLDFTADAVNIVGDAVDVIEMEVFIDDGYVNKELAGDDVEFDKGRAFVKIDEPRLYNVFRGEYGNYKLRLTSSRGFSFNAFTFG